MTLHVVDLPAPADAVPPGIVIATGDPGADGAEYWLQRATFTLTEEACADRRAVRVPSTTAGVAGLRERIETWPLAAAICDDVLRAVDVAAPALVGVITESLAYSTLQAGPEFARWLAERGQTNAPEIPDPVEAERDGDELRVRFNRPGRHNAFSTDARAALLDALAVARLDPSITRMVLTGNGDSFCSGGYLAESAPSPIRRARTWPVPGTARRWRSTRSPHGWARPAAPRFTVRYWGVDWRWRPSVGT